MMLRLFAKNNNLQYVDPTNAEITLTYDFYCDYLKKSSRTFILIALCFLIFPAYSLLNAILYGHGFVDFALWIILTLGLDIWIIICVKRYHQYIKDIKEGKFQIAYVNIQKVGLCEMPGRRHRLKSGCLWYDAPNKNGDITTWTARVPDKIAKELNTTTPKRGFVISIENQMEGMGVVWEDLNK